LVILFVHPHTDMTLREILPMSLPAIINRARKKVEVLGRFHDEWTEAEVRRATIITLDIHWFLGLASAIELSHKFKRINPDAVIVAGGASATIFAKQLLRDSSIDYILRGDGEIPYQRFVDAVLEGKSLEEVPNLEGRDLINDAWYAVTEEDMNEGDYRDISWFPTLEKRTHWLHKWSRGRVYSVHPFLVVFRGCPMGCQFCLGSRNRQRNVFRRNWVLRDAAKVREDLLAYSADPRIKFIGTYHDFTTMPPEGYTEQMLTEELDLLVRHEFYRNPSEADVDRLTSAFRGGKICFSLDKMHATSDKLADIDELLERIHQVNRTGRFESWISYVQGIAKFDPVYTAALKRVVNETGARPDRVDAWWDITPKADAQGYSTEEEYQACVSRPKRYWTFNRIFRASVYSYALAPRLTNMALRAYSHNNMGIPIKDLKSSADSA
jgi:hypothetical protein